MIRSGFPFLRLRLWGRFTAMLIALLTLGGLLYFLASFFSELRPFSSPLAPSFLQRRHRQNIQLYDYESIGAHALSIDEGAGSFSVPNLEREILLLSVGKRPGYLSGHFLVGLLSSKESRECTNKQAYYLNYSEGLLLFSEEKSPLVATFSLVEGRDLQVELALTLDDKKGGVILSESSHFTTPLCEGKKLEGFLGPLLQDEAIEELSKATVEGVDKLLELYGGKEFLKEKGKQRLVFQKNEKLQVLYISVGDLLIYDEENWRVLKKEEKTEKGFLAKILTSTPHKLELEVWGESGLFSKKITLSPQRVLPMDRRIEETFANIHQRTATTIALKLSGKSNFLKKGDWVLQTEGGWRVLKSWNEVERYLAYELRGQLFIFDSLEKSQGKQVFCGHLFDEMRSQVQSIKLPLVRKKETRGAHFGSRADPNPSLSMEGPPPEEFDDEDLPPPQMR